MREKFWQIAGTKMGSIVNHDAQISKTALGEGKEAADQPARIERGDEVNYKADSQYASAIVKKQEAVSEFARSKSIKEQREFLPVFSVREELLTVIRDNRIVVIVGETGSGKTTQLT